MAVALQTIALEKLIVEYLAERFGEFLGSFTFQVEDQQYDGCLSVAILTHDDRRYGGPVYGMTLGTPAGKLGIAITNTIEDAIIKDLSTKMPRIDRFVRYGV